MIGDHVKETMPGIIGNCASGAALVAAWLTNDGLPILHVISVVIGIIVGIGTAGYYFAMWRRAKRALETKKIRRSKSRK